MAIPKFHKTLALIGIVVLPIYWLMFTADGQRRTDTLLLWIMGGDPIDINFQVLDGQYGPEDWKKVYGDVSWQCQNQTTSFGEQVCFSEISSYNGIPSRYVKVYFLQNQTRAVKLVYRDQYHRQVGLDIQQQLGAPVQSTADPAAPASEQRVLQWQTDHGLVLIKQELTEGDEASLLWLSFEHAASFSVAPTGNP